MAMTVADAAAVVATAMIVAEAVGAVTTVADAVAVVATVTVMTVVAVGATNTRKALPPSFFFRGTLEVQQTRENGGRRFRRFSATSNAVCPR